MLSPLRERSPRLSTVYDSSAELEGHDDELSDISIKDHWFPGQITYCYQDTTSTRISQSFDQLQLMGSIISLMLLFWLEAFSVNLNGNNIWLDSMKHLCHLQRFLYSLIVLHSMSLFHPQINIRSNSINKHEISNFKYSAVYFSIPCRY